MTIPFNRPHVAGPDVEYAVAAMHSTLSHGDGPFTARATTRLLEVSGARSALLTPSCTAALDLAALLLDLGPGDEVLVPSFTFVSTANAIAMRGATPVFVDIGADTLNIDADLLEEAVTERTRAIFLVHYGGSACDMSAITAIAERHGLAIVEDNAHGLGATSAGRSLGTFGAMGTQSFHDTKNVQCGEGGALLINDADLLQRAEVLREKGTNRSRFLRGEVDKYTWVDLGGSLLPSDVQAAFLLGQLEAFDHIQQLRSTIWTTYARELAPWCAEHGIGTQVVRPTDEHASHVFALLLPTPQDRQAFFDHLRSRGVLSVGHYVPLHSAPAAARYARTSGSCDVTTHVAARLARLPLFADLSADELCTVLEAVTSFRPTSAA